MLNGIYKKMLVDQERKTHLKSFKIKAKCRSANI